MHSFFSFPLYKVLYMPPRVTGDPNRNQRLLLLHLRLLFLDRFRHTDHHRDSHAIKIPQSIRKHAVRQLPIPLILDLLDLRPVRRRVDAHLRRDRLLGPQPLDRVPGLQVHLDGVAAAGDAARQALDLAEHGGQAVPLRLVLAAALGDGEGVDERGVVGPEGELAEAGAAGEEVEHAAGQELLGGGEGDAGGGGDVCRFDAVLAEVGGGVGHGEGAGLRGAEEGAGGGFGRVGPDAWEGLEDGGCEGGVFEHLVKSEGRERRRGQFYTRC